jgi:hypothetical protein
MVGVEMDDGGSRRCLGCRQFVYGNLTETPPGECPTPYKSPKQLLDESVAREAALREELAVLQHWRDLALQFDNHRMAALWHLKALLQSQEHAGPATHAVMIDPKNGHYGRVLYKHADGGWVSSRKASEAEMEAAERQDAILRTFSASEFAASPPPAPASKWRADGASDPHGDRYDCERADLCMGHLTDDELANAVYLSGDQSQEERLHCMLSGLPTSTVYLTAAKDRIRWLSRALEKALAEKGEQ